MDERFSEIIKEPLPFENCEYEMRITGTVSTDIRIMSFVNVLWGFEVTGGLDQFEPLIVISVCPDKFKQLLVLCLIESMFAGA